MLWEWLYPKVGGGALCWHLALLQGGETEDLGWKVTFLLQNGNNNSLGC